MASGVRLAPPRLGLGAGALVRVLFGSAWSFEDLPRLSEPAQPSGAVVCSPPLRFQVRTPHLRRGARRFSERPSSGRATDERLDDGRPDGRADCGTPSVVAAPDSLFTATVSHEKRLEDALLSRGVGASAASDS